MRDSRLSLVQSETLLINDEANKCISIYPRPFPYSCRFSINCNTSSSDATRTSGNALNNSIISTRLTTTKCFSESYYLILLPGGTNFLLFSSILSKNGSLLTSAANNIP